MGGFILLRVVIKRRAGAAEQDAGHQCKSCSETLFEHIQPKMPVYPI
jgi:hypothetical protein